MITPKTNLHYVNKLMFKKIGDIGEGQYGVVEHWQTSKGQPIAIKRFHRPAGASSGQDHEPQFFARREAGILISLSHKNIVGFLDYIKDGEDHCLVLELVPDFDLYKLIRQQQRSKQLGTDDWYEKVIKFTEQLLKGLQYLHGKQVVHFDIKPKNLLVTEHGILKICDFGLSCKFGARLDASKHAIWSIAPELLDQLQDDTTRYVPDAPSHTAAVDIWGVGCVVFAMLTATHAFVPVPYNAYAMPSYRQQLERLERSVEVLYHCNSFPNQTHLPKHFHERPLRRVSGDVFKLKERLEGKPPECLEFLKACWQLNPTTRPSCSDLLKMDFFRHKNNGDHTRVPLSAARLVRLHNPSDPTL
eukprot:jgi/Botrbrau1/10234/Bobra.0362s0023.1